MVLDVFSVDRPSREIITPSRSFQRFCKCMSVSMSIYIAHRRKNNASNALNVPSRPTVQKETSSTVYNENSHFACPAHANCFGTSSMSLVGVCVEIVHYLR